MVILQVQTLHRAPSFLRVYALRIFRADLFKHRRNQLAKAARFGSKVHDDRLARGENFARKVRLVDFNEIFNFCLRLPIEN